MAAPEHVLVLLKAILSAASEIQNFADDWYTVSDEYKSQVRLLRERANIYGAQCLIYNLPEDNYVVHTLTRAKFLLQKEEKKIKKLDDAINNSECCGMFWWLYAKTSMMMFPTRLEKIITKVTTELDRIPANLKVETETADLFRKQNAMQAIATPKGNNDDLYVPITASQSAVTSQIEESEGRPIVLLHGGVGKGKSILARYVYARYGKGGESEDMFDHVILLPCGNCDIPDPSTLQLKILQELAPTMIGSEAGNIQTRTQDRIEADLRLFLSSTKILIILDDVSDRKFLQRMWNVRGKHVKFLVTSQLSNLCSSFASETTSIPMHNPSLDESRKILASLVGLEGQEIPPDLKDIADEIIKATEGNPLALACLASNFSFSGQDENGILDRRRWQKANKELRRLLDNVGAKSVFGDDNRSLWYAMKLSIDSLTTKDAKTLLFLMYACEGPSVAEEVLQVLYEGTKYRSSTFETAMDELVMRELVKRETRTRAPKTNFKGEDQDHCLQRSTEWSLRSLVKLYMEHKGFDKGEIQSVLDLFVNKKLVESSSVLRPEEDWPELDDIETEESEKSRVAAALCALYFDPVHPDKRVSVMAKKAKTASLTTFSEDTEDLQRDAIEPLISLLGQPLTGNWTESHQCCVRKVFLIYVCERKLEEDGIATLLELIEYPAAPLATLLAISDICRVEVNTLLSENPQRIFEALAFLLDRDEIKSRMQVAASDGCPSLEDVEEISSRLQGEACKALVFLSWKAWKEKSASLVSGTPTVLEALGGILRRSDADNSLRMYAARTLCNLASSGEDNVQGRRNIVNHEGALVSLVRLLSEHHKSNLPEPAALTLISIASAKEQENIKKILDQRETLEGLVKMLFEPNICHLAVEALLSFASVRDSEVTWKIVNQKWALSGLVKVLTNQPSYDVQISVANLFGILASREEDDLIRTIMVNQEGLLDGLIKSFSEPADGMVKSLSEDSIARLLRLQERAASALANLAIGQDQEPKLRILHHYNALASLVRSLYSYRNPGLLERAARALGNLAYGRDEAIRLQIVLKVVNQDGAIAGLVKLKRHNNFGVSGMAIETLTNLICRLDDNIIHAIAKQDGALVSLVQVLSERPDPGLEEVKAKALARLREFAASTLVKLVCVEADWIKEKIANLDGALGSFVGALSEHNNRALQEAAAMALGSLASSGEGWIKMKIVEQGGALVSLVQLLFEDSNPWLQELVARAFYFLAASNGARMRMRRTEGLLQGLSNLQTERVPPRTRSMAAAALREMDGTLSFGQSPTRIV